MSKITLGNIKFGDKRPNRFFIRFISNLERLDIEADDDVIFYINLMCKHGMMILSSSNLQRPYRNRNSKLIAFERTINSICNEIDNQEIKYLTSRKLFEIIQGLCPLWPFC